MTPSDAPPPSRKALAVLNAASTMSLRPVQLRITLACAESRAIGGQRLAVVDHHVGLARAVAAAFHFFGETREIVIARHPRHPEQLRIARAIAAAVRPVDGNALAHRTAEEIVDRHAERLALDVEQRVLDGGHGLAIDAAAGLHGLRPEMAVDQLDVARILADHHRRQRLDDPGEAVAAEALVVFRPADSPSSVMTLRNENIRQPASQRSVSMRVTFMAFSCARGWCSAMGTWTKGQ